MKDFSGATAAITGAADGIGLGLARALGKRGAHVVLLDIRRDGLEAAVTVLAAEGVKSTPIVCDVSDGRSIEAAALTVAQHFDGALNLLWVNAGVGIPGHLSTAPQAGIDWVHAVNVAGALATVRAFMPMVKAASGVRHIGFTASSNTLGHIKDGPFGVYAASKWALVGIAESVAGEAKALGIGATIFCPGMLNTRIWDGARARPDRFGGPRHQPEEAGDVWRRQGMQVDWACAEAIRAIDEGRLYCCPVDQHSVDEFEQRMASVRAGFVVYGN
jgi:NAD(P)-dependent dehydrogenase (short-subunit alcohol dehydrogenase family)